jgi:microcystin-dependent protein
MSSPFVGEIRLFAGNFAPSGWALCNGALLPISEYTTLFTLIGTTYGGDGVSTFGLPSLASRVPVHQGTAPFGTFVIGQVAGAESVTITEQTMPVHNHALFSGTGATQVSPLNALPGASSGAPSGTTKVYGTPPGTSPKPTTLAPKSIQPAGGSQPHDNIQPYVAATFIISLFGIFPSQS